MLGDREVLAATDGCGYGSALSEPAVPACRQNYQPVTIEPGSSYEFDVTLWRDLAGMSPVGDGPYEWSLSVDRRDTPFDHPDQTGTTGTVTLTYDNLTTTGPGPSATADDGAWRPVAIDAFEVLDDASLNLTLGYCTDYRVRVDESDDTVVLTAEAAGPSGGTA